MTLLELAERCENAAGPDRELDALIYRGLAGFTKDHWFTYGDTHYTDERVPFVTASLDAAMTLVPEDLAVIQMNRLWVKDKAQLYDGFTCVSEGTARSPALALCAAALRARHAIADPPKGAA